jgi:hypothetical protein
MGAAIMTKDRKTDELASPDTEEAETIAASAPAHASWLPSVYSPKFIELAQMLRKLLDLEAENCEQPISDLFNASEERSENDLAGLPILIGRMVGLPIVSFYCIRQELLPIIRTVLPEPEFDVTAVVFGSVDGDKCQAVIDALYRRAAENNSRSIADVADLLLYEVAVDRKLPELHHRLVQRIYETVQTESLHPNSLRNKLFGTAAAKLNVMRLSEGAPARKFLNPKDYRGTSISTQLANLALQADQSYSDLVASWIGGQRLALYEAQSPLAEGWTQDEERYFDQNNPSAEHMRQYGATASKTVLMLHDQVKELHDHLVLGLQAKNKKHRKSFKKEQKLTQTRKSALASDLEAIASLDSHFASLPLFDEVDEPNERVEDNDEDERGRETVVVLPHLPEQHSREGRTIQKPYAQNLMQEHLPLIPTPDLSLIRQALVQMLPHLEDVTDRILNAMAAHRSIKIPAVVLVGQPGCGKTTLLEELFKLVEIPAITVDGAGGSDANFMGVDYRWGTGSAGIHLDLIMQHKIGNPVILIDELEKVGGSDKNGDPRQKLLGLLEPRRAGAFFDPFLNAPLNLSKMSWVFTANTLTDIPPALQNRLEIIRCPSPQRKHLRLLAPQLLQATYANRNLDPRWCEPLNQNEMENLKRHWPGGSIRNLKRLVQVIVDSREKFMARA